MPPRTLDQVHDRAWRLPAPFEGGGIVNLYVIRGEKTALIDSGVLGNPTNDLAPALESLGLKLSDIDILINTHGHLDHLGGNGEMRDAGALIAIHAADTVRTLSNSLHTNQMARWLRELGVDEPTVADREAFTLRQLGKESGFDRVLGDGDTIDLGQDVVLRVVHTAGHTPGSICLLWESESVLFTGDSVQARGGRPGGLPVIEYPELYGTALKTVDATGVDNLFMAHSFRGEHGALGPVARGPNVREVIRESQAVHRALSNAAAAAVATDTGAAAARKLVTLATPELALETGPDGYPGSAGYTLPAYLRAALTP